MAYSDTILAEGTLLNYWPDLGTASAGGINITNTNATTGTGLVGTSRVYNGTTAFAKSASTIDLSSLSNVTLEFIARFPTYTDDERCIEFGADYNVIATGFVIWPSKDFGNGAKLYLAKRGNAGHDAVGFARPTANTWHMFHVVLDTTQATPANELKLYIDGVLQTPTDTSFANQNNTGNFGNLTLNVASKNGASLFGDVEMEELAIYSSLSDARKTAHFNAIPAAVAPVLSAAAVSANGLSVVLDFTVGGTPPLLPSSGVTGFSINASGSSATISSAARTSNTQITLTMASAICSGQTIVGAYAPGNVTDSAGTPNVLASIASFNVTNSSAVAHAAGTGSLIPGSAAGGSTNWPAITTPPTQGGGGDTGYSATTIVRWDCVPRQDVVDGFKIGLVAFHISGINRVEFYANNGALITKTAMALNSTSSVVEYFATLDLSSVSDGTLVEVRAVVYPNAGVPVVLQGDDTPLGGSASIDETMASMFLWCNKGGTMQSGVRYVDARATIAGTMTGTLTAWEQLTQGTTNATCFYLSGSNPITVSYVEGSPDNSHTWTGARSTATFAPSATPSAIGSSGNDGLTSGAPKATVTQAIASLDTANGSTSTGSEGCTVYIRGHVKCETTAQGTTKRYVTYAPWPGDAITEAVIHAPYVGNSLHKYLRISCTMFTDIIGQQSTSGGYVALSASDGSWPRWWINNADMHGIGSIGLDTTISIQKLYRETGRVFITGGVAYDLAAGITNAGTKLCRGLVMHSIGGDLWNEPSLIVNNYLNGFSHYTATDPANNPHIDIYQLENANDNVIIYGNTVVNQDAGQGITPGAADKASSRLAVVQNLFHTTATNQPDNLLFGTSSDHQIWWNNTSYHFLELSSGSPTNVSVVGNVFYNGSASLSPLASSIDQNHSINGTTGGGTNWTTGTAGFRNESGLDFVPVGPTLRARVPRKTASDLAGTDRLTTTSLGAYEATPSGSTLRSRPLPGSLRFRRPLGRLGA